MYTNVFMYVSMNVWGCMGAAVWGPYGYIWGCLGLDTCVYPLFKIQAYRWFPAAFGYLSHSCCLGASGFCFQLRLQEASKKGLPSKNVSFQVPGWRGRGVMPSLPGRAWKVFHVRFIFPIVLSSIFNGFCLQLGLPNSSKIHRKSSPRADLTFHTTLLWFL